MTTAFVKDFDRIPMSDALASTLARAAEYASSQAHVEVTLEHLLLALTEDSDAEIVLATSNVDVAKLKIDVAEQLGRIEERLPLDQTTTAKVSDSVRRILEAAAQAAQGRRNEINGAIVLAAIVGDGSSTAANLLHVQGLTFEEAIRALQTTLAPQSPRATPPQPMPAQPVPPPGSSSAEDFLARARAKVQSRKTTGHPESFGSAGEQHAAMPEAERDTTQPVTQRPPAPAPAQPANAATEPTTAPPPTPSSRTPESLAPEPVTQPPDTTQSQPAPLKPPPHPEPSTSDAVTSTRQRRPQNENTGSPGTWAPQRPAQPPTPPPAPRPIRPPPPLPPDVAGAPPPHPRAPTPGLPQSYPARSDNTQNPARPSPAARQTPRGPLPQGRMPPPGTTPAAGAPPPQRPPWPAPNQTQPPATAPRTGPPQQAAPTAGNAPAERARPPASRPATEAGQLVENVPRTMQVGVPTLAEVSIADAGVDNLAGTLQGTAPAHRHDLTITKAMTVRLRAPDDGFFIETASPETQWIDRSMGIEPDEFARWRWNVTPKSRGKKRLQVIVSARTVGADGLAAETALPDQVIEVKIRANYKKSAKSLAGWTVAAVLGGLLARFGENIWETGRLFVQQFVSGG